MNYAKQYMGMRPIFSKMLEKHNVQLSDLTKIDFPLLDFNSYSHIKEEIKLTLQLCAEERIQGLIHNRRHYLCIQLNYGDVKELHPGAVEAIRHSMRIALGEMELPLWLRSNIGKITDGVHTAPVRLAMVLDDMDDGNDAYLNYMSLLRVVWIDKILNNLN